MAISSTDETKVIYHIDDEDTPYLVKIPVSPEKVTLGDFKNVLNKPAFKFFFKSMDDDFGVVKEELIDDESKLPCFNGRVVSWLVTSENSTHSSEGQRPPKPPSFASEYHSSSNKESRPNSFYQAGMNKGGEKINEEDNDEEEEDDILGNSPCFHSQSDPIGKNGIESYNKHKDCLSKKSNHRFIEGNALRFPNNLDSASSVMTSDIESVSMIDSEDTQSRFSSVSGAISGKTFYLKNRKKKFRHKMIPTTSQASSASSITDSTMSLNIINVTLNMDSVNFLGISIVGQTNKGGDGGIYVGSIMKGGAVALDGRIEPGDMILEVNGVSFEDMSNDEAVQALRSAAQKPGPVNLVVAKCWDPNPKGYSVVPALRQDPVKPLDLSAWVAHTEAVRAMYGRLGNLDQMPIMSSIPECPERPGSNSPTSSHCLNVSRSSSETTPLSACSDPNLIIRAMSHSDSGLDIRDRTWLKINIPRAFIGSDLVSWLLTHIDGFCDRKEAKKFASSLLKKGLIRHPVNKLSFSEQCYYTTVEQPPLISQHQNSNNIFNAQPHNNDDFITNNHSFINNDNETEFRIYDTLGPPSLPPSSGSWLTTSSKPTSLPQVSNPPAAFNFVNDAMSLDSLLIKNPNLSETLKSSSDSASSNKSPITRKSNEANSPLSYSSSVTSTTGARNPFLNIHLPTQHISTSISSTATTTTILNNSSASTTSDEKAQ